VQLREPAAARSAGAWHAAARDLAKKHRRVGESQSVRLLLPLPLPLPQVHGRWCGWRNGMLLLASGVRAPAAAPTGPARPALEHPTAPQTEAPPGAHRTHARALGVQAGPMPMEAAAGIASLPA
jgi:hypothetical protein